jgi:glutaredoxin
MRSDWKHLLKTKPIVIFSLPSCPWCVKVKALLKHYTPHVVTVSSEDKASLNAYTGMSTYPQVYVIGRLLGGYTETLAFCEEEEPQSTCVLQ